MNILNRLRCWLRNEHRYMVADLALIGRGANAMNVFPGECRDCGAIRYRTAKYWQEVAAEPRRSTTEGRQHE